MQGTAGPPQPSTPLGLEHVYWLGGGSGAGKSTVAKRIAERHGLRVYSTDEAMAEHAARSDPDSAPLLAAFRTMDMDLRWVTRSPREMLETFHWFRGEGFASIVGDLRRVPAMRGVIAEGFRLLPRLVQPLLDDARRAVWLLPTPAFRQEAFERRGTLWEIANRTSNPPRALANLLERDRLFTERLGQEANSLGLQVITVDAGVEEDELAERVSTAFGL